MTVAPKQHRILIVDDVLENIKVLVHALEPEYKLSVATNGKDALRIANSERPPDLILLDIMMPGMDGYEVFRRLKSRENSARIPVIFLTAKSQDIDEELGLELGAVDYITKPFSLPIVKARVKSQIDRKKAEEAEMKLERLGAIAELASGVAHHFNNMLQVIMGGASVALIKLEQGDLASCKAMLQQIIESSRFGAHTVHRLQEFVKMRTSSKDRARDKLFDLSTTAQRAVDATKGSWDTAARQKGIAFQLNTHFAPGCYVSGNENEMFSVIVNVIRNALEAMPDGGELRIETSAMGKHIKLQIRDKGTGIASEHLPEVFEPFFTTKGFQRVGMGLASSFGIVKSHGGSISVESEQGQGAVFTVLLPIAAGEADDDETSPGTTIPLPLRILVIDDVEPIAKMLSEMLAEFGHEVVSCLSGEEGLAEFSKQPVDLVICDLGMPEMNGWEVGTRVKELSIASKWDKPPFILLTGWGGQAEEKTKMIECGVDAVVEKPLDPSRMYAVIKELVCRDSSMDREAG